MSKSTNDTETPVELANASVHDLKDAIESALVGQTRQETRTDSRLGALAEAVALEIPLCGGVGESLLPVRVEDELRKVGKCWAHQNPEGKLLYDEAISDLLDRGVIVRVPAGADTACLSRFHSGGEREVREPVYRLAGVNLRCIAADFGRLADRFQKYADRAVKPEHLSADLQDSAVRADRLLQKAAGAGAIERDPWWRAANARAQQRPFDSHTDRFRSLWRVAVGSWLARQYPHEFRDRAADFDWAGIATDSEGQPVGKDGEPLPERRYLNGTPLPDHCRDKPADLQPGDEYEQRIEGEIVFQEGFFDEADWLNRQQDRAEVYEDACRLLARLIAGAAGRASDESLGADRQRQFAQAFVRSDRTTATREFLWAYLGFRDNLENAVQQTNPDDTARYDAIKVIDPNECERLRSNAIRHAKRIGELAMLAPKIDAVHNALQALQNEAVRSNVSSTQWRSAVDAFDRACNDLSAYVDLNDEPPPPAKTVEAMTDAPDKTKESGVTADENDNETVIVPPRARKAWDQYNQGREALGREPETDNEVYDLLYKTYKQSGEHADLPSRDTWTRNLREHRRLTGTQKNAHRAGRVGNAGHFARVDQIEPQSLPTRIRSRWADK